MTQLHDVKTVKVNGVDVAYRFDDPENGPVLLVANSLMANDSMWDGNVAALADRYRILRYDKRGHMVHPACTMALTLLLNWQMMRLDC